MTRIYKHYSFALQGQQYKAHMTSMSSYPGMVTSMVSASTQAQASSEGGGAHSTALGPVRWQPSLAIASACVLCWGAK